MLMLFYIAVERRFVPKIEALFEQSEHEALFHFAMGERKCKEFGSGVLGVLYLFILVSPDY